jgi:hypothetical protein
MKTLIAAAAMSLLAGAAFAGEGNGDPFPFAAPTRPVQTGPLAYHGVPAYQNPYPFSVPNVGWNTEAVLPTNGSQGVVQTANSLPAGFANGTTAYAGNTEFQTTRQTRVATAVRPGTRG